MRFDNELTQVLPADLPHRERVCSLTSRYLELILEANEYMNLTRITDPREAAIKHVLDSVLPWRRFADARTVLDAGTGAGLPGIPLALVLPQVSFLLVESIQKKALFVQSVVETLGISNVEVLPERAEDVLRRTRVDMITARAVAPLDRALPLLAPAIRSGSVVLMYKGPDAEAEIEHCHADARKWRVAVRLVERYDLPEAMGQRTLVELKAESRQS